MIDDAFKDKMIDHMATQNANSENTVGWLKKLAANQEKILTGEAPICKTHANDIRELQKDAGREKRIAAIVGAVGGSISAGVILAVKFFSNRDPSA